MVGLAGIDVNSPDYVRNLITVITEDNTDVNKKNASQSWWVCGFALKCQRLRKKSVKDNHLKLHASFVKILKICMDILEIAVITRANYKTEEINFRNNDYRKTAYYQFCLWRYGKPGKGNRRAIPSCAVKLIRTRYPNHTRFTWTTDRHNVLQGCSMQLN